MGRSATHKRALAASIPHVRYDQSVKIKRTTPVKSCSCRAWYSHGRSRGVATCRDNVSQHGSRPDRDVFCHDSSGHLETSCEACRHVTPRRELPATCIASCGSKTSRASYQHQRRHENTGMDRHHMTCGALCCRSIRCPERRNDFFFVAASSIGLGRKKQNLVRSLPSHLMSWPPLRLLRQRPHTDKRRRHPPHLALEVDVAARRKNGGGIGRGGGQCTEGGV